jgi:hypothetical protein
LPVREITKFGVNQIINYQVPKLQYYLLHFFVWTLVLISQQASCSSKVMKLDVYKPTALKDHLPISGITAHATMPGTLEHPIISFCSTLFIQIYGA